MKRYRVLSITNNIEEYPEAKEDTLEFPDLVADVEDEMDMFVLDLENDEIFKADEFFYQVDVKSFTVDEQINYQSFCKDGGLKFLSENF